MPDEKTTIEVEINGEKQTYDADKIKDLVAQQSSATQKTQAVSAITGILEKHNLSAEDYLQQTEGAFRVLNQLVDKGLIDEEGNILDKTPVKDKDKDLDLNLNMNQNNQVPEVVNKRFEAIEKAIKGLPEGMSNLQGEMAKTQRLIIADKVQAEYPDLSVNDVTRLFALAKSDPTKSLKQHAEAMVETKKATKAAEREEYAKEFGVNLKEFDANRLNEQDGSGGAGAMIVGKKLKLRKSKTDGDDVMTPLEATREFFNKTSME